MQTKVCSKCGIEKEICEFHKCSKTLSGYRAKCKLCINEESRDYSQNNREIRNKIQQEWRSNNEEKVKEYRKKYYDNDPEKNRKKSREWRENNKDKVKKQLKKYYENNLEYHKERKKLWIEKNKERRNEYQKNWRKNNKEHINYYKKSRYKNDLLHKLIINCRNRINSFLKTKNIAKTNKTFEIIGCIPEDLKKYIETQFKNGMSWDNRSEWHIDHIIPLSSAKTEEEIYKLCHYTNLQPLWASENMKKSNKLLKN